MSRTELNAAAPVEVGLAELIQAARGRIALLAALNFCWFMVLPTTIWLLVDARFSALLAVAAGVGLEVARLIARQKARRNLRLASMSRAAERALGKGTLTAEVLADSAFWGAHIIEYAASIDLPAIVGATLAVLVTLGLAGSRSGFWAVAQVGAVLLCAVGLGVLSNRLRRRGVYAIVDARERTAVWMAATVRDRGELASPKATAAFLRAVASAVERWCSAEDRVERARTRHRLLIAVLAMGALYAIARGHGLDPLGGLNANSKLSGALSGAALLGSCFPAAYALAVHLDSLAIAKSELGRLTFNAGERRKGIGTPLTRPPSLLHTQGLSVHHGQQLALFVGDLELALQHPIGIAGPNGSGKTTFAMVIAGVLVPSGGRILLDDVLAHDVHRDDVAFVPQDPVLIEPLSVLENLQLVAPEFDPRQATELLQTLGLGCSLDSAAGNLSRGEQRRIAIARALLKKPKLLVLDEPDAWLDVEGRHALLATLNIAARTSRVIVVSHRPDMLVRFETVIVLSADHRVEAIDAPARLRQNSPTFCALLGEDPSSGSFESGSFSGGAQ